MRCSKESKICEEISGDKLEINDINIGSVIYDVLMSSSENLKQLEISFIEHGNSDVRDYSVMVDEKGISFRRYVRRPNHDHDDFETLQISTNASLSYILEGTIQWKTRYPYRGEGWDFFYIPFGSKEVKD